MKTRTIAGFTGFLLLVGGYIAPLFYIIPRLNHDDRAFALVVAPIFFLIYVFPYALFGSRIKIEPEGIHVERYRTAISFADVAGCHSFFTIPFHMIVIRTSRRFPLNLIVSIDRMEVKKMSFLQEGEYAAEIKARMAGSSR